MGFAPGVTEEFVAGADAGTEPPTVVAVALANKMARGIGAMLTRGEIYRGPVQIGA